MKKLTLFGIIFIFSMPLISGLPEEAIGRFKIKITAEQANIREKPDIGSAIVLQILEGTILQAEKKEGAWYLVRLSRDDGSSLSGYIHESLVTPLEAPAAIPKPEAGEPPPAKGQRKTEPLATPLASTIAKTASPSPPREMSRAKAFGFSISGGTKFASIGDLNAGAQGLADYYVASTGALSREPMSELHMTYVLGAEFSYRLASGLYAVLGAEYLSGRHSSQVEFSGNRPHAFQTHPRIRAVPIKIGLSYYLFPFLYVKGDLHFLLARCEYFYRLENGPLWQEWRGTAKTTGLGAGIAVGGEWEFYPGLSLVGEAGFNFARIAGFKGKNILLNSFNETYTEDGVLYYFKSKALDHKDYPLVFIRDGLPAEPGVSEAREARIDFSGMSLKTGIRVRF